MFGNVTQVVIWHCHHPIIPVGRNWTTYRLPVLVLVKNIYFNLYKFGSLGSMVLTSETVVFSYD